MGSWYDDLADAGGTQRSEGIAPFVGVPDFEKVLKVGLRGTIRECEQKIREFTDTKGEDLEALEFWQSVIIVCEAVPK